jgi:SgrR family transcriptional regulator
LHLDKHYLSLREHFKRISDKETFSVKIGEIVDVLQCTRRNAQLLMNRMSEERYIVWVPGRGRGNASQLTFLKPVQELILEKAIIFAERQKLQEAWKLIDEYPGARLAFTDWAYNHLGFEESGDEEKLRFPFYRPVPNLDPTFVSRRTEAHLINQMFNKLVKFENGQIVSDLAHFWESNEDFSVWRFYLRKGVRFHHGRVMTSKDVAFTFSRYMESGHIDIMRNAIKEIRLPGKYSIEFVLTEPNAIFADFLCSERYSILPFELNEMDVTRPFSRLPVGTGPFQIVKNSDSLLLFEANDDYFEGRPWLDKIEIWIWPNYNPAEAADKIQQDDLYLGGFPAETGDYKEITSLEAGATYVTFNLTKQGPLQDKWFRKAVHFAIDREKMIMDLGAGRMTPADSFSTSISLASYQSQYDLELAKTYLAKSSYRGEKITLYTYVMPSNEKNANWLKGELSKVGINVEVVMLPVTKLSNQEVLSQADMVVAGEVLGIQEDADLIETFTYRNGFIYNHLGEGERQTVEKFISLCKREKDSGIRKRHLRSLETELTREYKLLFLYHTRQILQHSQSLKGIIMNGWGNVDYKNIWIKK